MLVRTYLKTKRKEHRMTQRELSEKAGVGLRLIREIEQGKSSMTMEKVNQVLALFGAELGVITKQKQNGE